MSKSKFEPTPISVAKWGYWKKKGKERKFVISFAATIVESRIPIPAHNRHHWCAIARTGLTRGRVFELERQGASTKVIEQAEHDFEDAKAHSRQSRAAVCWEGSPEPEGCIAFRIGRGSGYTEQNECVSYREFGLEKLNERNPNACAVKCRDNKLTCQYFAIHTLGNVCRLYVHVEDSGARCVDPPGKDLVPKVKSISDASFELYEMASHRS